MNATNFSAHTGLAPSSNVYVQMLQAKMEREQKRNEMLRLEARLKKLQAEEEKTVKRVNDARRQQDFVSKINNEKQKDQEMK
jgi:hypothetical protein